jgi:hypothetical protein
LLPLNTGGRTRFMSARTFRRVGQKWPDIGCG